MKRKKIFGYFLSVIFVLYILAFGKTSVKAEVVTSQASFTYYPTGGSWSSFGGVLNNDTYLDCIKIQTDPSKSYYLSYKTYNEGKTDFYKPVTSIENNYAGLEGRKIQKLSISVFDKATKSKINSGIVVMYRVKASGRWLPWVSNADPNWMYFVQRKYGITGVLDTASGYAGLDDGSYITNVEIKIFEEQAIIDSKGESGVSKNIDVPYQSQVGEYPTGCESVSAVMALRYYGMEISVDDFIDSHLKKGSNQSFDPNLCFGGDPRSESGMGCYAPVIRNAVNSACKCYSLNAETIYGASLSALCKEYIDNDIPVIIWATVNMATPKNGKKISYNDGIIQWISPEHCLVLVGYDENNYIFNDPLQGKNVYFKRNQTETAYCGLGMQAVVINGKYCENHTFGEWITITEPTITSEGIKHRYCSICNKLLAEESIEELIYYGDVNGDNILNALDIAQFRKIMVNGYDDYNEYIACDLNNDSKIDLKDFVALKKKLV